MIPLPGFSPDADPTIQGIFTDCHNLVPNSTGFESIKSLQSPSDVPALAATCLGAGVVTKLDGSRRVFAGTQTKIYELSSGSWVDRSGATYTGSSESYWSIAQFGDATLMANKSDGLQRSTTAAFSTVSGAPKSEIIFSVGSQVMALNTDTAVDQWWCCKTFDDTDWTPSVTTQAGNGRLVSQPGPITAGGKLGEYAVAYKSKSIYIGQYVGGSTIWDWTQVRGGNAGCVGKRALVDVDGIHYFIGEDNIYVFDGTAPVSIADGIVRKWFNANCSSTYRYRTAMAYDKTSNLVWIFFPSANASTLDTALTYNVLTKKWGKVSVNAEIVLEYISSGITIDGLNAISATIDELPAIPFDSSYWLSGAKTLSVFNTSHQLQSFSGDSGESYFITGDYGDDFNYSLLRRVKLRFVKQPTSASLVSYYKNDSGDDWTEFSTVSMDNGRFDILQSARWHKAKIGFNGNVSITAMGADLVQDGEE